MGKSIKKIRPYALMAAAIAFPMMAPAAVGTAGLGAAALQPMAPMLAGPGMFTGLGSSALAAGLPSAVAADAGGGMAANMMNTIGGDIGSSLISGGDIGGGVLGMESAMGGLFEAGGVFGAAPGATTAGVGGGFADAGIGESMFSGDLGGAGGLNTEIASGNTFSSVGEDSLLGSGGKTDYLTNEGLAQSGFDLSEFDTLRLEPTPQVGPAFRNVPGWKNIPTGAVPAPRPTGLPTVNLPNAASGMNPGVANVSPWDQFTGGLGQMMDDVGAGLKPITDPIKGVNKSINSATGGFVGLKDILGGAYALSQSGQQPPQVNIDMGQQAGGGIPEATRPDVRTAGITGTTQLPGFQGGAGWDALTDEQKVSNLFTGISSGRGGLTLPGGNPSDPANLQAARQAYMNLASTGGNINPGYTNLFGGGAALKKLGKPLQDNTSAGLLSALRELIEQQNA